MTKQGTMMVIEYYNTMKSFLLELDYYQDFKMQCSDDVVVLKKIYGKVEYLWISCKTQHRVWSNVNPNTWKWIPTLTQWGILIDKGWRRKKNYDAWCL